jgi:hypothetical protein
MPMPGTAGRHRRALRSSRVAYAALAAAALLCGLLAPAASAGPPTTRLAYAPAEIVPIPASIPHEEGDMVDRRIVANLRWLARRFPIYVTDGYSGRLPSGEHAGCHGCHVKNSDHHNGLAVDIVPLRWSDRCDANWRGITRLARWAEPLPNRPVAPFRWVGYDGDSGHGCGHHLHLSWEHATVPEFRIAEWVEIFPVRVQSVAAHPRPDTKPAGVRPESKPPEPPAPKAKSGPIGGISATQSGGIAPRGD